MNKDDLEEVKQHVQLTITNLVGKPNSETVYQETLTDLTNYLKDRNLRFTTVDYKKVCPTWQCLYPNLFRRCLAWLAYKLQLPTQALEEKWYHKVFPYNVTISVDEQGGKVYSANLDIKKEVIEATFSFEPLMPIPEINLVQPKSTFDWPPKNVSKFGSPELQERIIANTLKEVNKVKDE